MTRVILTNKKTGQGLPEAELVHEFSNSLHIRFDGAARPNVFSRNEWDYREVRAFRNGDVLRRKDRSENFGFYVYTGSGWAFVNWGCEGISVSPIPEEKPAPLDDPEWGLV